MMELAQIPKLDLSSSSCDAALESKQKSISSQRISVSDHINAYQCSAEKVQDSFVIDMDSFSSSINRDSTTNANSRTTLQRSLSRKGSQQSGDRNVNSNGTLHDRDTAPTTTCSPKAALLGSCKSKGVPVGSTHNSTSPKVHHQITVTAGNICTTTTPENKCMMRRSSFGRSSPWLLDPKKVVLVFATLSSMGTLLLIFFTLAISKQNAVEYEGDLQ